MAGTRKDGKQEAETTSPLEWAFALFGALLVLGTAGYMIYYGVSHPSTPPNVTVSQTASRLLPGGHLVEFVARNDGNSTAAGLVITGTLMNGGEVVEVSEVRLDYLPQQGQREGGLVFQQDPADHAVRLKASGYSAP